MHVAEMDFEVAPGIRETLLKMITESDLGYLGPIPEVGEAFSKYAANKWQWHVDPNQIKLATDVGVAAVEIFRALVKPGDKIIAWLNIIGHNFRKPLRALACISSPSGGSLPQHFWRFLKFYPLGFGATYPPIWQTFPSHLTLLGQNSNGWFFRDDYSGTTN